ncbi:hypothetical protein Tco_1523275 [Tanacetum coccineum]
MLAPDVTGKTSLLSPLIFVTFRSNPRFLFHQLSVRSESHVDEDSWISFSDVPTSRLRRDRSGNELLVLRKAGSKLILISLFHSASSPSPSSLFYLGSFFVGKQSWLGLIDWIVVLVFLGSKACFVAGCTLHCLEGFLCILSTFQILGIIRRIVEWLQ